MQRAAILILAVCALACTVHRRTDSLECRTTADCSNGRTCQDGYCVGGGSGSATCPSECSSCNFNTSPASCTIEGSGGAAITCPSGMSCTVICSTAGACGNITCSSENCVVQCVGASACGNITCDNACGCQVTCSNRSDCGTILCPQANNGNACAPNGSDNTPCSTGPAGCSC